MIRAKEYILEDILSAIVTGGVGGEATPDAASSREATQLAVLAKLIAAPSTEAKQDAGNTSLATLLTKIDALLTKQDALLTALALQAKLTDAQPVTGSISVAPDAAANREVTQADIRAILDTICLIVETMRNNSAMPDAADRMRCNVETGTVAVSSLPTLAAVTTVTSVTGCTTVGTVTNQSNMGGYQATGIAFAGYNVPANQLLPFIAVTP